MNLAIRRELFTTLGIALAYFVTGKLGLWLAIPPGYATVIWPASGIALASMFIFGGRSALGIFLGSFAINLSHSWQPGTPVELVTLLVPSLIAIGAVLQAMTGKWLVSYWNKPPHLLIYPKEILILMGVGGPLACLVGATNGTLTLVMFGIANWESFWNNWLNWWIGDTMGVWVFTPITLILLQLSAISRKRAFVVSTLLGSGFAVVVVVFAIGRSYQFEQLKSRFQIDTYPLKQNIENQIQQVGTVVHAVRALYNSSQFVSRDEFHQFIGELGLKDYGMQAIYWVPVLNERNIETYSNQAIKDGYQGFTITEQEDYGRFRVVDADSRMLFPVFYSFPVSDEETLLGYDLGSHPKLEALLQHELVAPSNVLSEPLLLTLERHRQLTQLYFLPLVDGHNELTSLIVGRINPVSLIESAESGLDMQPFSVRISDVQSDVVLYDNNKQASNIELRYRVKLLNRHWNIDIAYSNDYLGELKDWSSWWLLIGGLVFIAIFGGILLIVTGLSSTIEKEVEHKTRELIKAKENAERADQAKSTFITNMSHELRTPLNGVLGMLELSRSTVNEQKQRSYINKAEQSAQFLLGIISNLLDFSKVESNTLHLECESVDLSEKLTNTMDMLRFEAESKNIELVMELDPELPQYVWADSFRLEQILTNLLHNAIKFTHVGQVVLSAGVAEVKDKQVLLTFGVKDTGIGISEKDQARLFNPFMQLDGSKTRRYGGVGLGLSLTQRLVTLMGGKLQCESDLNKGSYFSFSLPVTIDDRTSDNQPMPAEPLEVAGLRCLVVEDNLINREVVATLLENEGIEVVLASNGQEGVDRMQAQTFDCVLMDIQMPVMDGLEATKRIRLDERFKHIPIFALSAHASPDDVQHSLDAGMNEHITKPINPEQLLTTIARYCS